MRPVRNVVTVDDSTGEVVQQSTVYVSSPQSEPFYVKVYLDSISGLWSLRPYCLAVLVWLLRFMPYANADQCFQFGAPMREKAAKELKMSTSRVNHAVSDLMKCGVLLRESRGLYQFNPSFFARGEWKDIQKLRSCR